MQYGTYSLFSWDIMEPIACTLEAIDLVVAYLYWLRTDHEFELADIEENMMSRKQERFYRR